MKLEPQKPAFEGEVFNLLFIKEEFGYAYKSTDPADLEKHPQAAGHIWLTKLNAQALNVFFKGFVILPISQLNK